MNGLVVFPTPQSERHMVARLPACDDLSFDR